MVQIKVQDAANSIPTELLSAIKSNNKIESVKDLMPFRALPPKCFDLCWVVTIHRVEKCPAIQMHYLHYTIGQEENERDTILLSPRELGDIAKVIGLVTDEDLCFDNYVLRSGKEMVSWIKYTEEWSSDTWKEIVKYRLVKTLLLQASNHWFVEG